MMNILVVVFQFFSYWEYVLVPTHIHVATQLKFRSCTDFDQNSLRDRGSDLFK